MKTYSLVLGLLLLGFIAGCGEDPSGPAGGQAGMIRGRVVDGQDRGVANAIILLNYTLPEWAQPNAAKPSTQIIFNFPEAAWAKVWISDYCREDTVKVLMEGELPPGAQVVAWDGRDSRGDQVVEGVYYAHIQTETEGRAHEMLLIYGDIYATYDSTDGLAYFALTDRNGYFAFSQECLPFGDDVEVRDEHGSIIGTFVIPRQIKLWAIHDVHGVAGSAHPISVGIDGGAYAVIAY